MKALVVFGSTRGNTRAVVGRLPALLRFPIDIVNVAELVGADTLKPYDLLIFFASTWGDGELQLDMERFLSRQALQLDGKRYVMCELGNYYGYDDFEFGAMRIMQHHLDAAGGIELMEPFSMDSLPRKDWNGLARWCGLLNLKAAQPDAGP